MSQRVRIPGDLIEGPAKVYFAMRVGQFYTPAELEELAGVAKSTCARYLQSLREAGVVETYRGNNPRGRPAHFYRLAVKETRS